ncbi:MAG: S-methyl-5'-thioadenosine phosphorylase [Elusimicrobiota bacterium]
MGMDKVKIAVIGGSGLYDIDGISDVKEVSLKTPYGSPSDVIVTGVLEGIKCAFLPRHGKGHKIMPTEVNYRANIYALKSLGVEQILSISACGSLKEELPPRTMVLPDQYFDRTKNRVSTFFGGGIVAHVAFANPTCGEVMKLVYQSAEKVGIKTNFGGTYVCIEGPMFSTKAESHANRVLGFSIVGMTAIPEAKLAREAEICYTTIAFITDYDVWKEGEEVTSDVVISNLNANIANAKKLIKIVLPKLMLRQRKCECANALKNSIFTTDWQKNKSAVKKLGVVLEKYL